MMYPKKYLTINGATRHLTDWSRQPGAAKVSTISERLARGLDPEEAVFGIARGIHAIEINGIVDTARGWSRRRGARGAKAIAERLAQGFEPVDAVFYYRASAPVVRMSAPERKCLPILPTWGGVFSLSWRAA